MARRPLTVLAILALGLTGTLTAIAGPAGAASSEKTYSDADCEVAIAAGSGGWLSAIGAVLLGREAP